MLHLARRLRSALVCVVLGLGVLGGCASTGDPRDPLEPLNRGIHTFNDGVDTMFIKPAAEVYQGVVPGLVRTGVSNVFSNINDVIVALNNLLQGKFGAALSDVGRVLLNTTAGLFGIFDVATPAGLEKHDEDFGQTFGYWGIGDGPYLVLPFLGPRTTRDAVGTAVYFMVDPVANINPPRDRNQLVALRLVSDRASLLSASRVLAVAALDEYEFVRDAYLQRRRNLIYDGNPPREKLDDSSLPRDFIPQAAVPAAEGSAIWSGELPTPAEEEAARRNAADDAGSPPSGPAGVTAMSAATSGNTLR
ncbi:MAG: VacJ family lipoprotein [Burkholderiales bacterium]|nr:VacJ family lipoprotein [Burkholderiales bacterium]